MLCFGVPMNIQALEVRQQLYELIQRFPGMHFREIQRRSGLAIGTLQYHMKQLIEDGLITGVKDGEYVRFYPVGAVTETDKFLLQFLRQTPIRRMLVLLLEKKRANHKQLTSASGVSPATTSWYLGKLLDAKIVVKKRAGREVFYSIAKPREVMRTMLTYKESFLDKVVERFIEIWEK